MRKMYLAICDDEASILGIVSGAIASTLEKYDIEAVTEIFARPRELEGRMREQDFELLFLDIDMPEMDGITLARRIRAKNSYTDIIFISNREDKVFDALRVNPAGFIRKKRFLEDVPAVLEQWMKSNSNKKRNILIAKTEDGTISVPVDTILYIEGTGRYQTVHSRENAEPISVNYTMKDLEEKLEPQGFLRIHKGFLVNFRFIKRLTNTDAILTNDEELPISRLRVQEIRNSYLELMKGGGNIIL